MCSSTGDEIGRNSSMADVAQGSTFNLLTAIFLLHNYMSVSQRTLIVVTSRSYCFTGPFF